MISFYTIPKGFSGHIGVIQRNAIRSWLALRPKIEILLLGDDPGTAEFAAANGLTHLPGIDRNEFGTPLLSSVIEKGEAAASNPIVCWINADIILMSDFLPAVRLALESAPGSLVIGRRRNLRVDEELDFAGDWESPLLGRARKEGELSGVDFMVHPRGLWGSIPPFALGRSSHEKWLIWRSHDRGVSIVDITQCARVIHQDHHYQSQGVAVPVRQFRSGAEGTRNLELGGGPGHLQNIYDADYTLVGGRLRPNLLRYRPVRALRHAAAGLVGTALRALTALFPGLEPVRSALRRMSR